MNHRKFTIICNKVRISKDQLSNSAINNFSSSDIFCQNMKYKISMQDLQGIHIVKR